MAPLTPTTQTATPCLDCSTVSTGGASGPAVILNPGGSSTDFWFQSDLCVTVNGPGPAQQGPQLCTLLMVGQLQGFNTAATGSAMLLYETDMQPASLVSVVVTMAGDVFSLVGTDTTNAFRATFAAAPNPGLEPNQRPANGLAGRSG